MIRKAAFMLPAALVACSSGPSVAAPRPGTERAKLLEHLAAQKIACEEIAAGDAILTVVPAWGARIEGAFFDDENVFWIPENLAPSDPKETWNKGGARTWLAPEGHDKGFFFSKDWKDWNCPAALDLGDYKSVSAKSPGALAFANECALTSTDGTTYRLRITREVGACPAPLPDYAKTAGVRAAGIHFAHRLKNLASDRAIDRELDLWSLMMIKGEATLIVPVKADGDGYLFRDYFEPVPPELISTNNAAAVTMRVDGRRRYKIGVSASRCLGLTGSFGPLAGGHCQLIVKRFAWDPAGTYADKPKYDAGRNGDPIQTYNHTGEKGVHFYEIECHGPAVVLKPGDEQEHAADIFIYRGPEAELKKLGSELFGVDLAKLRIF